MTDKFTAQLSPGTASTVSGQYFDLDQPFAFPRYGNTCTAYTTGRDYMQAVADAINQAHKFIFITDWQLDYDVELEQRGVKGHPGRLSERLAEAVQRGVHVRVILYDSFGGSAGTPDTHDDTSQPKLEELPKGKGSLKVMLQNPNSGRSGVNPNSNNEFFSHHQKSVLIDGHLAFVGGLDLAYGRWDTNAFDVVIDRNIRIINDAYNMQIATARKLTQHEIDLTKSAGGRPGFQEPYSAAYKGLTLDESFQPRQPWQDISVSMDGPAAFDVFVNFVLRWNSFAGSGTNFFDSGMDSTWFESSKGWELLVDPLKKGAGSASVQICRSASSEQLKDELPLWDFNHKYVSDDWKSPDKARHAANEAARKAWQTQHQTSIRDAMINCIRSAQGLIYIENQFFMSNCGPDERGSECPSSNAIIAALAYAVRKAIHAGRPFHIYLVLPEHPEGSLVSDDKGTISQAWWALQGVARARNSLVNRINAEIALANSKTLGPPPKDSAEIQKLLKAHGMQDNWKAYLTVLNLRNFGHTKDTVVTEMVYVHSKLLIVDDAVAIIGSANINDRSLNGNGDTELAAVICDDADARITDIGQGIQVVTRKFARDLRQQLWRKHLGMLVDVQTTGVKQQASSNGVDLEKPLSKQSIEAIKTIAASNRAAYNDVFLHTPRDSFKTMTEGRLAYVTKSVDGQGRLHEVFSTASRPRLQAKYMTSSGTHDIAAAAKRLTTVCGFWVEMPLQWGLQQHATPEAPVSPQMIAEEQVADPMEHAV